MRRIALLAVLVPALAQARDFTLEGLPGAAPGRQDAPDSAWNGERWLVAWMDEREPTTRTFFATRVSAKGEPEDGAGIRLAETGGGRPNVAGCGKRWFVVWDVNEEVHGVRVDDSGNLLDKKPLVIAKGAGQRGMPAVACAGSSAVVVWADQRAGHQTRHLYAVRVDVAAGRVLGREVALAAEDGPVFHDYPAIAWNGSAFLVAWRHLADSGRSQVIRAVRVSPELKRLDAKPLQLSGEVRSAAYPRVAASGDSFLVVFVAPTSAKPAVRAVLVSAAGQVAIEKDLGEGTLPQVAGWSEGFGVAWAGQAGQPAEVFSFGRDLDGRGRRVFGTPPKLQKGERLVPSSVAIAAGGDALLVSWGTPSAYTPGLPTEFDVGEVVSARVSASLGGELVERRLSTGPPRQLVPVLASDGARWAAAWLEQDGASKRVSAAPLGASGFGRAVRLSAEGASILQGPAIGAGGGQALIAWTTWEGTCAARLDPGGKVLDTPSLVLGARGGQPSVAFDGTRFVVAWGDGSVLRVRTVGLDGSLGDEKQVARGPAEPRVELACLGRDCLAVWEQGGNLGGSRVVNGVPAPPEYHLAVEGWRPRLAAGGKRFHLTWSAPEDVQLDPEEGDPANDVVTAEVDPSPKSPLKPRALVSSAKEELLVAVDWLGDQPTLLWLEDDRGRLGRSTLRLSHQGRRETIPGGTGGDVRRSSSGIAVIWSARGRLAARVSVP